MKGPQMLFSPEFAKRIQMSTLTKIENTAMHNNAELEVMACQLEKSPDYRVLRRLVPREPTPTPDDYSGTFGIVIDFETTGLDVNKDEIIEVAMLKFRYSSAGEVTGICGVFQAFNQPSISIPGEVIELTGISDDMVAGHKIDGRVLEAFAADARIIIAHNAGFDRRFAERSWKFFEHKPWGCSATEIEWRKRGFAGAQLSYILSSSGFFHESHRAIDDCQALVELLARPLPNTTTTALAVLLDRARRPTYRIWAENAPFDLKDSLKRRRYRWNDGSDGRPKAWFVDVDEVDRDDELKYLTQEIYQREVDLQPQEITALTRFSDRA
jgi:DNA polymerase III subunit epsilon